MLTNEIALPTVVVHDGRPAWRAAFVGARDCAHDRVGESLQHSERLPVDITCYPTIQIWVRPSALDAQPRAQRAASVDFAQLSS